MLSYGKVKRIYQKSPEWAKGFLGVFTRFIPISVMYGKGFKKLYKEALETQHFSEEKLKERQNKLLRELIMHSYENVPYYTKLFKKLNLKPEDIKTKEDLKKLPILTKEDIRNNFDDLTAKNYKQFKPDLAHTSGSTGKKLYFYLDQKNREKEYALVQRQLSNHSIDFDVKTANFRGDFVHSLGNKKSYEYNPIKKEMIFSTFDLDEEKIRKYISLLKKFKPGLIKGYPSAMIILSRHIMKNNIRLPKVGAILTSSENMIKDDKDLIEKAFRSNVINWYGASEYVVSAGEYSEERCMHFNDDFSIVEVLDNHNLPVEPGKRGRIIATSLFNYSMPFIRYEQEDLATLAEERCSCGRSLTQIKRIDGRTSDIICSTDGREIPHTTYMHYWKHKIEEYIDDVIYVTTIQKSKYDFHIELLFENAKCEECSVDLIEKEVKKLLGDKARIEFKILEKIPSKEKWRFIKNEWKKASCADN